MVAVVMAAPRRGVERLRRRRDFIAVMRNGRRSGRRLVGVAARSNGLPHSRWGFAVGRRAGNAVARNRTRRRLREIMRQLPLRAGLDIVVTAHPASEFASFRELQADVERCARDSDLLVAD
jgi:ribonuclease P protein component